MEDSLPSERATIVRCDDDKLSVCDGVGMDGEWQHHGIYEVGYQHGSIGTCMFFSSIYLYLGIIDDFMMVVAC